MRISLVAAYHWRWCYIGGGTVLNCSRRGIVWTWGHSSLLAGFVRSETGWGMELFLQGQCFKTRLEERDGVFISICFFPLPMTIQDDIFMDGSW